MGKQSKNQMRRRLELERPIEPVRITTTDEAPDIPRELLFSIDDTEYTIPKEVPADLTVAYLNNVRKHGTEYAVAQALTALIGEDAMDELSDCPQLTTDNLRQIMRGIERKMLAASEAALGNS